METEALREATQYLSFMLGNEIFAIEISKVREVLDYKTVTKVPQTPDFMKGVINLRGNVVPVIDMRLKLGMAETERTVNTCIVIVEVEREDGLSMIGALADSVQEVIELDSGQVEPPPRMGTSLKLDLIEGIGKVDERFIIILDIDRVFSSEELGAIQDAEEAVSSRASLRIG